MAFNAYATSLRGERLPADRVIEDGVPFFVPQLSKVKTNVMCQTKNQHLLFCFEKPSGGGSASNEATLASASYRKQGNQDLYSAENLLKRQRLLDDKQVVAALARFWDTFPHIRQGAQSLESHDYVDVFMKFYKALVSPSEFSMAEARRIVERDWERDVGHAETSMTRTAFLRALFEVADIWTVGIGADIYASFLTKLYDRVTMKVYDKDKCVWLTVFADIDKIRPFEEPKSDELVPSVYDTSSTNQTLETSSTPQSSTALSNSGGALDWSAPSMPKARPPLLKKKMLSVPSGLGSPTKSSAISMLPSAEAMGGSMRRLPDLQAVATEAVRTLQQHHPGIASRAPRSPVASPEAISGRSEGAAGGGTTSPVARYVAASAGGGEASNDGSSSITSGGTGTSGTTSKAAMQSAASTRLSTSPTRTSQRSASLGRRDGGGPGTTAGSPAQRKRDDDADPVQMASSAPAQPEIPPQHVRLAMPSIYLSPEITPAHSSEKAARRRIRESMKLAQRLRRITF